MPYARINVLTDQEFTEKSAILLSKHIQFFIKERGHCTLGLSGGTTPKPVYEHIAKDKAIDWNKVTIFLVDDRYVTADQPNSNQQLIRTTLLTHARIPADQIVLPHTHLPLEKCVETYDLRLRELLEGKTPDVVVLGMGDDGHIASLFPPVIDDAFASTVYAIHTTTDRFDVRDRISVTLPVLVSAKIAVFLLKGETKRAVWEQMLTEKQDSRKWPAQAVLAEERSFAVIG